MKIEGVQASSNDEITTMISLATLALIRSAKCETWTRNDCNKPQPGLKPGDSSGCTPEKVTTCSPSDDVNVQMYSGGTKPGTIDAHAFLHLHLTWNADSTSLDCSVLDAPFDALDDVSSFVMEAEKASEVAGYISTVCDDIEKIFSFNG
jgi:hypothetical protein